MASTILVWLLVIAVALVGVRFLLFLGACALADVQPNLTKALLLSTATTLVMYALLVGATLALSSFLPFIKPTEPSLGGVLLPEAVTLVGLAVLSFPVYLVSLPTSTVKAVQIAGWEQGLLALLYSLVVGVAFVVLALYQLFTYKPV